ncbi:hypothetical protein E1267_29635 [Nonomuraea longispora]|uniref:Uncharacterized protein n=1 Tax=Nonomuraea longispora TaxID=1848320 RepID=A0A4R4N619_9ACTN|nr:hypothetical protein [Nonomuraea longispora]TDC02297.1 hypothetical protein E1267_29635 [Nonomuraea longispora]
MTASGRWTRSLASAAATVLLAACSSSDEPHTLTFDVTGEGRFAITYVINGRPTTEPQVTPPWRKDITLAEQGKDTWSLSIRRLGAGSVSAVAYVDGQRITSTAGSGTSGGGTSDLSGSVG